MCLEVNEFAGPPRCFADGGLQVLPVVVDPAGVLGSRSSYNTSQYFPSQKKPVHSGGNGDEEDEGGEDVFHLSYTNANNLRAADQPQCKKPRLESEPVVIKNGELYTRSNTTNLRSPLSAVVCYVCHAPDIPGKFDPQKALQLGIPKGPLYGMFDTYGAGSEY